MTESRSLGAAGLLRSVGLLADGPVRWGSPVRVGGPGLYVVELPGLLKAAPIDHQLVAHLGATDEGNIGDRPPAELLSKDGAKPVLGDPTIRYGSPDT